MTKNEAFEEFIGQSSSEDDNGWSKEVWDAAWAACQKELEEKLTQ
jgi:hypothetical protein